MEHENLESFCKDRCKQERYLLEQLFRLGEWNKEHINSEPEQARKNIETIAYCLDKIYE